MDGALKIESAVGAGTKISIAVPLLESDVEKMPKASTDHRQLQGKRILVVDDRETNCEIARAYLEGAGALVECARTCAAAMTLLRAAQVAGRPFEAAVLDLVMPDGSGLTMAGQIKGDAALASIALVLATSLSWKGDGKAVREAGIREFLTKPLRRSDLLDAVSRALSAPVGRAAFERPPQNLAALPQYAARVLLAEDNPVNQEVALEYLKSFGCQVDVANNGLEAVAAADNWVYDLILMDCQMPELDGYNATRQIRSIEQAKSQARTPIVALTANAYASDRQNSLAAGMDDHLTKPFTEVQLSQLLAKALQGKESQITLGNAIDRSVISDMLVKRPALFERLLRIYMDFAPKAVAELKAALGASDCTQLKSTAHSLKSSSANVGAMTLAELCKKLEAIAGAKNIVAAAQCVASIEEALKAVIAEFTRDIEKFAANKVA